MPDELRDLLAMSEEAAGTPDEGAAAPVAQRPAPASTREVGRRPLDRLVALQHADGSWALNEDLAICVGVALDALRAGCPLMPGAPMMLDAWATLVALAWLEAHAAGQVDEWTLLALKAERWLEATLGRAVSDVCREAARVMVRPRP